jgi:oligoribonuclease
MYVFLDLETTGLDPKTDLILEAAFAIVDDEFEIIDERVFVFPASSWTDRRLNDADPVVIDMHTGNHLFADMAKLAAEGNAMSYNYYRGCLEAEVLNWFAMCGLEPNTVEMAGSSVHFDRAFLKVGMPALEEWFHYRNWDTSTLKRAAWRFAPEWYMRNPSFEYESSHRALPDVRASIHVTKLIRGMFAISEQLWAGKETPL